MDDYAAWRSRLAEANDPAFWPIEAIDALLVNGDAQFWANDECALVTRVVRYPGGAVALEALAGAGNIEGMWNIAPQVEEAARAAGCTHLLVAGRPGWVKSRKYGWRHHQSIILRELADGQ